MGRRNQGYYDAYWADKDGTQLVKPDGTFVDAVTAQTNPDGSKSLSRISHITDAMSYGFSVDADADTNNAALQAALDNAGVVSVSAPGTYMVRGHLALKSNTHLLLSPGVVIKQDNVPGNGQTVLATDNFLNGVWQEATLTWTAGQIVLSIELEDHGLVEGNYACLRGADQTEYIGVFLVISVEDSDNFTVLLRRCPSASPTGTIEFIKAHENITIEGGTIDYNMADVGFSATQIDNICTVLAYGANLYAINVGFANASKFSLCFGATAHSGYDRIHGNGDSDGIKLYGPAFDFEGGTLFGRWDDDSISVHPYESDGYSGYRFTFGSILGATIGRMHTYSGDTQIFSIYPNATHYIDDLVIEGFNGAGSGVMYIGGASTDIDYTCMIKKLTFRRAQFNRDTSGSPGFPLYTDKKPYIQELRFESCGSDNGGYTGAANNEIKLFCKVDRVTVKGGTWKGLKFTTASTFICNVYSFESVTASEVTAFADFSAGTVGLLIVRELYMKYGATLGGAQRCAVVGPGVASVAVSESTADAAINAMVFVPSGQTNNPKITLKNNTVNCAAGVSAESRCVIEASGNVCNNVYNGLVRVRYSTETYKVYGEGNTYGGSSVPIAFITTPVVQMYSNNISCDVTALARVTGAYCYNTNAAAGTLGSAGLVICQGTAANSWKLLANTTLAY